MPKEEDFSLPPEDVSLPPDIQKLLDAMPKEEADKFLSKILEAALLDYQPLKKGDVDFLKSRCTRYGMLEQDMDFSWNELRQKNCIAIGAFDTEQLPVAFLVAEIAKLREAEDFFDQNGIRATSELGASTSQPLLPQPTIMVDAISPQHFLRSIQCGPDALTLEIRLLGVDFEYRRQGIGLQLLDFAKQVAQLAGARMAWLNVAEFNPNAIAFYEAAGFVRTSQFKAGPKGDFPLLVMALEPVPDLKQSIKKQRKGSTTTRTQGKSGKGFGPGKVQAAAVQHLSSAETRKVRWLPRAVKQQPPLLSTAVVKLCRTSVLSYA